MSSKTNLIIGILVVAAVVGLVLVQSAKPKAPQTSQTPTQETTQQTVPVTETQGTVSETQTTTTGTTTTQTKTTFTRAEVATHATSSDCWTIVDGNVYNVTSWINKHPGGAQAILGLCGVDGSAAFNGQHGDDRRPASELAGFKIGTLAQ